MKWRSFGGCPRKHSFTLITNNDSLDWKGLTAEAMEARVLPKVKPGSILLFHNNGKYTTEALPAIIGKLQEKGFKFVTVSELIGESLEAQKKQS